MARPLREDPPGEREAPARFAVGSGLGGKREGVGGVAGGAGKGEGDDRFAGSLLVKRRLPLRLRCGYRGTPGATSAATRGTRGYQCGYRGTPGATSAATGGHQGLPGGGAMRMPSRSSRSRVSTTGGCIVNNNRGHGQRQRHARGGSPRCERRYAGRVRPGPRGPSRGTQGAEYSRVLKDAQPVLTRTSTSTQRILNA
jgi:hypothetical protein